MLLGLLADDPTLEPRDILVMCPDIEAYAPLITAAFGMAAVTDDGRRAPPRPPAARDARRPGAHPDQPAAGRRRPDARHRRRPRRGQPHPRPAGQRSRTPPLRLHRERPGDDHRLGRERRHPLGLRRARTGATSGSQDYVQNTWRFGLDRILAGAAVSDDAERFFATTLPLDDVASTSIDLAGRLAECIDRLQRVTDELAGEHPVNHWLDAIRAGVDELTDVARGDEWQRGQLHRELTALADDPAAQGTRLRLSDVRALMAERLAGRPTRANFRTGTLTICTMTPMRSVPHRVVCLLGVDDGVFPRAGAVDGDDVLARRR